MINQVSSSQAFLISPLVEGSNDPTATGKIRRVYGVVAYIHKQVRPRTCSAKRTGTAPCRKRSWPQDMRVAVPARCLCTTTTEAGAVQNTSAVPRLQRMRMIATQIKI